MVAEEDPVDPDRIDWKWEYKKLDSRIEDVFDELQLVKKQIKSAHMKIARMKHTFMSGRVEGEEELEEEREPRLGGMVDLTDDQKAILVARLLDEAR